MILHLLEERQNIAPSPSLESEGAPTIVVRCLAAHADHRVDRRGAADDFAAWISERAAIEASLDFRAEHPVGTRITDGKEISSRNVVPNPIVQAAGFEQKNAALGISGEAIGQNASRGPGAHNDAVIVSRQTHHGGHLTISWIRNVALGPL